MPKTAKVTIGERAYTIAQKATGAATAWREHLNNSQAMRIFQGLDTAMIQLVAVADTSTELVDLKDDDGNPILDEQGRVVKVKRGFGSIDVAQVIDVAKILPVLVNGLSHSMEEIKDMLFDYSVEMAKDKAWIEENGFDEEIVSAFVEVLKICYPFLEILALVRGAKATPISSNLPTANGASGRKAVAHRTRA